MDKFRFQPELFEHRTLALEALAKLGYEWFTHFTSIDLIHDVYGLEVCGIGERCDALQIQEILNQIFPEWEFSFLSYKETERDRGWKVIIHRDPDTGPSRYSEA